MNALIWRRATLNITWLITACLLAIGLTQPMFTFTHFYFFDDTFSLIDGVFHLATQGEYILFGLLFCFSLLMPIFKMLLLGYSINATTLLSHKTQRQLDNIGKLGKWSMLDVYVIAVLAVTLKLSMIASVSIHYGLIAFAVSVTLSMLLPWLISYALRPETICTNENYQWQYQMASYQIRLNQESIQQLQGGKTVDIFDAPNDIRLVDVVDHSGKWHAKAKLVNDNNQLSLKKVTNLD